MFCPLSCCTLTEQSRIKWEMACGSACVKKTVKVQHEEVIFPCLRDVTWAMCRNLTRSLLSVSQIWTSLSNAPTSAPSTCSSTLCWTSSSRAWPSDATPKTPSTRECASAAGRTAATRSATTWKKSARPAAQRCTSRLVERCLSKVKTRKKDVHVKRFEYLSVILK